MSVNDLVVRCKHAYQSLPKYALPFQPRWGHDVGHKGEVPLLASCRRTLWLGPLCWSKSLRQWHGPSEWMRGESLQSFRSLALGMSLMRKTLKLGRVVVVVVVVPES